jgi:leucyl/phenylalanyl-tRNA--protein transferase
MPGFGVQDLLDCYRRGVFPMGDARDDPSTFLVDPQRRGVIPLGGLRISRRLGRTVRADVFDVRVDTAFDRVVATCAEAAPDRPQTWINRPIEWLYGELYASGHAHSVECWKDEQLVGGLYGVSIGGAFFGESMFSRARDASKVALVHLVARLVAGGYRLLDTQFLTPHLASLGAEEISRAEYRRRLRLALAVEADFYGVSAGGGVDFVALGAGGGGDVVGAGAGASTLAEGGSGGLADGGRAGAAVATRGAGALALQVIAQAS